MPIPILLAGLGVGAALLGAGGHLSAKETNEKAQRISEEAESMYNDAKESLEIAQGRTEEALLKLGYAKKEVLETSIAQFLIAYERIKNIQLSESIGLDEIKNFTLEKQDALQLREMSDIYQATFSSGVAGAATGAVITLAASGSLPVVTGVLSTAGSALMAGEIGMAAGLAGSALSFGAAMTPLAAIAAPALLFSGISSSIKADENLEKANAMYAEAEVACEQMKTSEVLCEAIVDRSEMFDSLLKELNYMFAKCTVLLDNVTKKKMGFFKNKVVDANTFSEEELKLVAVTRALAGAVKAVIDTPILDENGALSEEAEQKCNEMITCLPEFQRKVEEVESYTYKEVKKDFVRSEECGENEGKKLSVFTWILLSPILIVVAILKFIPVAINLLKFLPTFFIVGPLIILDTIFNGNSAEKPRKHGFITLGISWYLSVSALLSSVAVLGLGEYLSGICWLLAGLVLCPIINKQYKIRYKLFVCMIYFIISSLFMNV